MAHLVIAVGLLTLGFICGIAYVLAVFTRNIRL